jgi:hypothetical protein
MADEKYLGDGVYATFDGYQVWLAVNDHKNVVVALEPNVLFALADYAVEHGIDIREVARHGW